MPLLAVADLPLGPRMDFARGFFTVISFDCANAEGWSDERRHAKYEALMLATDEADGGQIDETDKPAA